MINLTNTQHWLFEQTGIGPERRAVVNHEKELTYNELLNKSSHTANYFLSLGIKENDNIGILFGHDYKFWVVVNALWFIGAVPIPLNSRNTNQEIQNQIHRADVKFLILDETLNSQFYLSADGFSTIVFQSRLLEDTRQIAKQNIPMAPFNPLHSALIMFTSGSSGNAKAVVHTFKSLFESVSAIDSFDDLSQDNVWLASLPLYHIGGFMILVRSLLAGSSVAFPLSLKFNDTTQAISEFNPTHLSLVSTTLLRMLENKTQPNNNLKYVFLGGGPSDKQLCIDAVENGWPIVKVYGSTETCSMVTALDSASVKLKPDSSGKVLGTNIIKITSQNGSAAEEILCRADEHGNILVKSNSLFKEYYNDSENTKNKLIEHWYHTGDFGWMDADRFLFVEARREDLIITGGENVSASEVEAAIKLNKLVSDVFVFAVGDETWGQKVCAALVSKSLSESDIKNFLKEKLAGYKIPKQFFFIESIPRNEMGKVKRAELLKQLKLN